MDFVSGFMFQNSCQIVPMYEGYMYLVLDLFFFSFDGKQTRLIYNIRPLSRHVLCPLTVQLISLIMLV